MRLHQFEWPHDWPLEKRTAPSSAPCAYEEREGEKCGVLQINHPQLCSVCHKDGAEPLTCPRCWNGYVFPAF
ncbi:hypothetical protein ES703_49471 [subsurface metagenome]